MALTIGLGLYLAPSNQGVASSDPVIESFTAGPQAGDGSLPMSAAIIDSDAPVTGYVVGVDNGETAPTITEIKAGQKSGGAAAPIAFSQALTSGDNSFTATVSDPPSGDYDFYLVATDNLGNDSSVSSVTGVTLTFGLNLTHQATSDTTTTTTNTTYTFSGLTTKAGARHVIQLMSRAGSGTTHVMTLGGETVTTMTDGTNSADSYASGSGIRHLMVTTDAVVSGASNDLVVTVTGQSLGMVVAVYSIDAAATIVDVHNKGYTAQDPISLDGNTSSGDSVLAMSHHNGSPANPTSSVLTFLGDTPATLSSKAVVMGYADGVAAGTPLTIEIDHDIGAQNAADRVILRAS